ncbi:MAG TPA: CHAT domain-containing tetratricopeptide repeat protein, partial [Casimicrobiaceae bacterium]
PLLAFQGGTGTSPQSAPPVFGAGCPSPSTVPDDLIKAAQALRDQKQVEAAAHCQARAADLAAQARDTRAEGAARMALAQSLYERGMYDPARVQADRARVLADGNGDGLAAARMTRMIGSVAYMRGDQAEARRQYTLALDAFTALGAERDRVLALMNLARTYDGEEELLKVEEVLALARTAGARDVEAMALHLRADKEFSAGKFAAAITDASQAAAIYESVGDTIHLPDVYVSLGRIMRAHGRFDEAIVYYDRALALQEQSGDMRGRVQSLNAKAIALSQAGRLPESKAAYERALELAKQTGSQRLINFQQGNLAGAYGDVGDYASSIALLKDVIPRESDPFVLAYRHGSLASNLQSINDLPGAREHIDKALTYARRADMREFLPQLLWQAARIYRAEGRTEAALGASSEGVAALEALRAHLVPLDYMKRGFSDTWQSTYGVMIALLHERGDNARALATSELARSRAFLDLLASRDLADREPAVAPETASLMKDDRASGAVAATATAADIAATAARFGSTVVSYWVSDQETFIWVASEDGIVHATRIAIPRADLKKLIESSIPAPGRVTTEAFTRLHRLLIQPVAPWLPRGEPLTIIPHGPLFRVSFAALRDAAGVYLIERHALTYAPSISSLALTGRRAASVNTGGSYVLVADPSPLPVTTPKLVALPASRREVSAISAALSRSKTSVFSGAAAREGAVRAASGQARVIHFATHGFIRDDEPFDSFLALGASGTESEADGRLTVRELYDMPLHAELVVMSACRTATGAPSGDGIAGLSRALFYAGTSSVLATLWDVADEPSATLMAAFYRNWSKGMDKRAALRAAQLELL